MAEAVARTNPVSAPRDRRGVGLLALMLGITTALVLLMQWFVVTRTVPAVQKQARESLDEALQVAAGVWHRRDHEAAQQQIERVRLVLADQGFIDTLHPPDPTLSSLFSPEYLPTLADAVDNFGRRAGYAFAVIAEDDATPRLVQPPQPDIAPTALAEHLRALSAQVRDLPRQGKHAPAAVAIRALGTRAYRLVASDLGTHDRRRWMMMAFALQPELEALAADMRLELALVTAHDGQPQSLFSTLPAATAAALARLDDAAEALRTERDHWRVRSVRLVDESGQRLVLRLARSMQAALDEAARIRTDLVLFVVLGLAIFASLAWLLSHFVFSRNLSALVAAAGRLGRQRYDEPVTASGPVREFRLLAKALDQMRAELRAEEFFDRRLTQLPNRLYLRQRLEAVCAQRGRAAVLLIGLNRFKEVNRRLGYGAGDQLLVAMGQRLRASVRPQDFVARIGGDIFAVLLPDADGQDALAAAQRIGQRLGEPMEIAGNRVDRQVAAGIAYTPEHGQDPERLLACAEMALYAAKDAREPAVLYTPAIDRGSASNLALLSELRRARENDELRLLLQPKVSLRNRRVTGAEALLRWEHPQRGVVPPGQFIPYAEDTPIIRDLTLWVFEAVARQQSALRALGLEGVSINLSARDLMDLDLPNKLQALLAAHGARADGLCLETTETAVMADIDRAKQTLVRLADAGFKLSIDDFGAGQTSMRYLREFPVHELKIDMEFVRAVVKDARTASIVKALIQVGHECGLTLVAEGIESEDVARQLLALGCDEGQGWLFGRPMPVADFTVWLQRQHAAPARHRSARLH